MEQYNSYEGQYYVEPQKQKKVKKGKVLGIIALVIGILSMTLCCAGGLFIGIIGIALGIISLCFEDAKGMAITGIVTSVIGLIFGAICAFGLTVLVEMVEIYEEGDYFAGCTYETWEGEVVYFDDELDFEWYVDDSDHSDNYAKGQYLAFSGELAHDLVVENYDAFGLTLTDVKDIFDYFGIGDYYSEENLCILCFVNDQGKMDGDAQEEQVAVFVGCYDFETYWGIDILSGEEILLYMIDDGIY